MSSSLQSNNVEPNQNNKKNAKRKHNPKSREKLKDQVKDPSKNYKYLQVKKLFKKIDPVTINGMSIAKLCQETQEQDHHKAIDKYLLKFVSSQSSLSLYLSFVIIPSDPDFPFDLDMLKVSLCIPPKYPYDKADKPSIYVLNEEIPRGFAVNIEMGFKKIVNLAIHNETDQDIKLVDGKGLLSQIKTLDKYLEAFLKQEKRRTIKFIKGNKPISQAASPESTPEPIDSRRVAKVPLPKYSKPSQEQMIDDMQRQRLVQQLNSKLKHNIKLFNKSRHSEKYKITLPINTNYGLPSAWLNYGKIEVLLTIPKEYPNLPLHMEIFNKFLTDMNGLENCERYEINLIRNFLEFTFSNNNIVSIINQLCNNLSVFCMDSVEFNQAVILSTRVR